MKYFLVVYLVQCATITLNWNITFVDGVNPDGKFPRRAIGINNKWPPPPIELTIGDTLRLNVQNHLDVTSGLHTHGIFHNNTNYYDGAIGITECGIAPGSALTYEFLIEQKGTYWIHGHRNGQYVDGLQAPLIVRDPAEPTELNYEKDYVLSFTDWYHEEHPVLLEQFLGIFNPQGAEPIPDSAIINHGQDSSFKFEAGKTYRLRLISMTAIGLFNFYIDDHKFKIIEVDGVLVEPYETDVLYMSAAQRYSVLVTAKENPKGKYLIHAKLDQDMLDSPSPNPNATASIIYDENGEYYEKEKGVPSDYPSDFTLFDQMKLIPKDAVPNINPDTSIVLDVDFVQYEDALNHGTFNRTIFAWPPVPSIFTAMSMNELALKPTTYGPRTLASVLKHLDMVEIIINNKDPGHHPFHIHGHQFQIAQVGKGVYDPKLHSAESMVLSNPIRRDTVIIPAEGFAVIKFRADNPGVWLMHCHIEWHLQAGLASIFIEAPEIMQQRLKIPKQVYEQCQLQDIKTTGNAAGFDDDVTFTGIAPNLDIYPEYLQAKGIVSLIAMVFSAVIGFIATVWYSSFDFKE